MMRTICPSETFTLFNCFLLFVTGSCIMFNCLTTNDISNKSFWFSFCFYVLNGIETFSFLFSSHCNCQHKLVKCNAVVTKHFVLGPLSNTTFDDLACVSYFPVFSPVNEEKLPLNREREVSRAVIILGECELELQGAARLTLT